MSTPEFGRVQRGDWRVPSSLLNAHSEAVETLQDAFIADTGVPSGQPVVPYLPRESFLAQITGGDGSVPRKYSWLRWLEPHTDGFQSYDPDLIEGGPLYRSGDLPAYEQGGNLHVPTDGSAIVRMWSSWGGECYEFEYHPLAGTVTGAVTFDGDTVTFHGGTLVFDSETFQWTGGTVFAFPASLSAGTPPAGRLVLPVVPAGGPSYSGIKGELTTDCNSLYKSTGTSTWMTYPPTLNLIASGTPRVPVYDPATNSYTLSTGVTVDVTNLRMGVNVDAGTVTNALSVENHVTTDNGVVVYQLASSTGRPLLLNAPGTSTAMLSVAATGEVILTQPVGAGTPALSVTALGTPSQTLVGVDARAGQPLLSLTSLTGPSQPLLRLSVTGTPTGDVFELITGTGTTALSVDDNYYLKFPTTGTTATAPAGNLSLPALTVSGTPTWTPPAGEYPVVLNSADGKLWVWDGSAWVDTSGTGSPGGSPGELQWNNAGAFDGVSISTWTGSQLVLTDGTSTVTVPGNTSALSAVSTPGEARLADNSSAACVYAHDGTRTALLADSTYAVNAAAGGVNSQGGYYAGGTPGGSYTVTLAALTGGGTNGSLTVTDGLVTGYTPPT